MNNIISKYKRPELNSQIHKLIQGPLLSTPLSELPLLLLSIGAKRLVIGDAQRENVVFECIFWICILDSRFFVV